MSNPGMNAVMLDEWLVAVRCCSCAPCRQLVQGFDKAPLPDPSAVARARREWGLDDTDVVLLRQVSYGKTNNEIGASLAYSPRTIRNKLSLVYAKLGVGGRAEAARISAELGLAA